MRELLSHRRTKKKRRMKEDKEAHAQASTPSAAKLGYSRQMEGLFDADGGAGAILAGNVRRAYRNGPGTTRAQARGPIDKTEWGA